MIDDFIPQLELDIEIPEVKENSSEGNGQEKVTSKGNEESPQDLIVQDDNVVYQIDNDEPENPKDEVNVEGEEGQVSALYKTFVEKGYVDETEDSPKSWDDLDAMVDSMPKKVAEALVQQVPEVGKQLMKYLFSAGETLTLDSLKSFMDTYITEESEVLPEEEEHAKSFLLKRYTSQGMSERAANATIEALEDEKELLSEAKRLFEKESAQKKTDEIIKETDEEKVKRENSIKNYWNSIAHSIKETSWDIRKQKEVYAELSTSRTSQRLQEAYKHPKALVQLADFMTHFNNETGEFNLNAFKQQVASKEAINLQKNIMKDNFSSVSSGTISKTKNTIRVRPEDIKPIFD